MVCRKVVVAGMRAVQAVCSGAVQRVRKSSVRRCKVRAATVKACVQCGSKKCRRKTTLRSPEIITRKGKGEQEAEVREREEKVQAAQVCAQNITHNNHPLIPVPNCPKKSACHAVVCVWWQAGMQACVCAKVWCVAGTGHVCSACVHCVCVSAKVCAAAVRVRRRVCVCVQRQCAGKRNVRLKIKAKAGVQSVQCARVRACVRGNVVAQANAGVDNRVCAQHGRRHASWAARAI